MSKYRITILAAFLLVLVSMSLAGCGTTQGLFSPAAEPTAVPTVTTSGRVTAEGRIVPKQDTTLIFLTSGEVSPLLRLPQPLRPADAPGRRHRPAPHRPPPATVSANDRMARTCAGVVPQHPPITFAPAL